MENYLDEQGLATYDTLIKSYISGVMTSRSEIPQSQMAVINDIDSHVDTMYANYVTKTDLQSALANIGGSEAVTIYVYNASGNAHVDVTSGTTVIKANVSNGETLNIPLGIEYIISSYDASGNLFEKITRNSSKISTTINMDCSYKSIDLGLPSGKLWADRDTSGNSIYYSYGNITGYNRYSLSYFTSSAYLSSTGGQLTASYTSGDPTYDAARANMGGDWRTPTKDEFEELIGSCTRNLTNHTCTYTGTNGNELTFSTNGYTYPSGNSASYIDNSYARYWTCTMYSYDSTKAYGLSFGSGNNADLNMYDRAGGHSIRAIRDPQP